MKQFEVNGQQYLAVEVPEGAKDFEIGEPDNRRGNGIFYKAPFMGHKDIGRWKALPAGNYEIVGVVKDLTNDDMRNILGYSPSALFLADWVELKFRNNLTDNTLILKIIA